MGPSMVVWATCLLGAALLFGARDSAAFAPAGIPLRAPRVGGAGLSLRRGAPPAPTIAAGRSKARAGLTWCMSGAGTPGGKRENEEDESMPLSFQRSDNGTRNSEFDGLMSPEAFDNIYMRMVESISPGEMVGQFMNSASPRVQAAVKSTIMGLLGSLRASPQFDSSIVTTQRALASLMFQLEMTRKSPRFDSSIVTTQRALASLMFQLEMTGYMFRNAEYRVALRNSLSAASNDEEGRVPKIPSPKVSGKITVYLGGQEVEGPRAESLISSG
ncbi:hypothetical protein T484DRAFT_1780429 [Baffinella frigidus]|nr:hypothetical protein T484DRAFT_1780429 [Cryptophyta sp. CCMP2293]